MMDLGYGCGIRINRVESMKESCNPPVLFQVCSVSRRQKYRGQIGSNAAKWSKPLSELNRSLRVTF